ncbi:MAG TPA: response regulator [Blastocatellia bacterium]|nr:response regulator [Blastocatellia bacterium]
MLNGKFKILVVEDEENTRMALEELLQLDGFDVVTACNGEDGYQKALWCQPDMIITDLVMPVLDGLELSHRIRCEQGEVSTVPILALSGNLNEYHLTSRLNSGINRFLRKPISDYRSLAGVIRSLLVSRNSSVPVV